MSDRFEAIGNGLLAVMYLWLGVALIAGPHYLTTVQKMTEPQQVAVVLTSGLFSSLCAVMLATKFGLLRTTPFTTDHLALPIISIYTFSLFTL